MPNRVAMKQDTVIYRNAKGKTRQAVVLANQVASPALAGISTSTSGGTLAAATYSYRISWVYNGALESAASTAKTQVTTGATSTVTLDVTGVVPSQATSWKVYGRTGGSELLMGTVTLPTLTFTDTGAATPSGALPANTGLLNLDLRTPGVANVTSVPKQTTYKGVTPSYVNH